MTDNHIRLFADILSIDAWHSEFTSNSSEAKVYVEMSFQQGRIGGDVPSLPFTFSIRLKKARLSIKVNSPLVINKKSISRGIPDSVVELTRLKNIKTISSSVGEASASVSLAKYFIAMSGSAKKESEVTLEEQAKIIQHVPAMLVKPIPGNEREYCWEIEPSYANFLDGQPWDPVDKPRLTVRSDREIEDPLIKVFVSCKREDLEIDDLVLKDDCLDAKLNQILYREMNKAAAIQHIKHILEFAQLEPGALDNRFSSVILADLIAMPGNNDEF